MSILACMRVFLPHLKPNSQHFYADILVISRNYLHKTPCYKPPSNQYFRLYFLSRKGAPAPLPDPQVSSPEQIFNLSQAVFTAYERAACQSPSGNGRRQMRLSTSKKESFNIEEFLRGSLKTVWVMPHCLILDYIAAAAYQGGKKSPFTYQECSSNLAPRLCSTGTNRRCPSLLQLIDIHL